MKISAFGLLWLTLCPLRIVLADRGPLSSQPLPGTTRYEFGGVIAQRSAANIDEWLLRAPTANPGMLGMFRMRDRQPRAALMPWSGEFAGKYLTSLELAMRMSDRADLREHAATFVADLIATQADDGYLGPFPREERLLGEWDLWGHYHVMLGLLSWHERTGDPAALAACRRAADLICRTYLEKKRPVSAAGSPEMNMAVIHGLGWLFRLTGEERYRSQMLDIVRDWEGAGDYLRTGLNGVEFFKTPRPRWESLHCLQGLVELWRITGDERYRTAFEHHWRSILKTDIHNAGSFSSGEQASGNAFAPGAIETCCTVAWMALTTDMLHLTGDPAVADELERSTLNGALAAQHPSGRWWTYDTPMNGARKASAHEIVFQAQPGTPELNCCSVNGPRTLGLLTDWAVQRGADGAIKLNWHGPMKTTVETGGKKLTAECVSNYPVDGRIVWTLNGDAGVPVDLRIPGWATGATVSTNGAAATAAAAGRYFRVVSTGKESLELTLPMPLRTMAGEREQAGRISIFRGPLLLAFDPRWNDFDEPTMPSPDVAKLAGAVLKAASEKQLPPWLLIDVPTTDGRALRLCDYASAGATGTRVRSWLTVAEKPPSAGAPAVAASLRGSLQPTAGRLVASEGIAVSAEGSSTAGAASKLMFALPEKFGAGDFTVAMRLRLHAEPPPRLAEAFSAWTAVSDDPLRLVFDKGRLHARIENRQAFSTGGVRVDPGPWHHIAAVKNGDWLILYVDGTARQSAAVPLTMESAARDFALGRNPHFSGDESLAADFADLAVYTSALPPAEIARLARPAP